MSETSSSILLQCSSKCRLRGPGTFVDFCVMMFCLPKKESEGSHSYPAIFFGHLEFRIILHLF